MVCTKQTFVPRPESRDGDAGLAPSPSIGTGNPRSPSPLPMDAEDAANAHHDDAATTAATLLDADAFSEDSTGWLLERERRKRRKTSPTNAATATAAAATTAAAAASTSNSRHCEPLLTCAMGTSNPTEDVMLTAKLKKAVAASKEAKEEDEASDTDFRALIRDNFVCRSFSSRQRVIENYKTFVHSDFLKDVGDVMKKDFKSFVEMMMKKPEEIYAEALHTAVQAKKSYSELVEILWGNNETAVKAIMAAYKSIYTTKEDDFLALAEKNVEPKRFKEMVKKRAGLVLNPRGKAAVDAAKAISTLKEDKWMDEMDSCLSYLNLDEIDLFFKTLAKETTGIALVNFIKLKTEDKASAQVYSDIYSLATNPMRYLAERIFSWSFGKNLKYQRIIVARSTSDLKSIETEFRNLAQAQPKELLGYLETTTDDRPYKNLLYAFFNNGKNRVRR